VNVEKAGVRLTEDDEHSRGGVEMNYKGDDSYLGDVARNSAIGALMAAQTKLAELRGARPHETKGYAQAN